MQPHNSKERKHYMKLYFMQVARHLRWLDSGLSVLASCQPNYWLPFCFKNYPGTTRFKGSNATAFQGNGICITLNRELTGLANRQIFTSRKTKILGVDAEFKHTFAPGNKCSVVIPIKNTINWSAESMIKSKVGSYSKLDF